MRYYENGGRWIILKLDNEIDYFYFNNVLDEIVKEFKESDIKFAGWLADVEIVSIGDKNYKIFAGKDRIKLVLTEDKSVKILERKKYLYKKRNEYLKRASLIASLFILLNLYKTNLLFSLYTIHFNFINTITF